MKKVKTVLSGLLAGLTSASCASAMAGKPDISHDAPPGMEKCYGVMISMVNNNPVCGAPAADKIAGNQFVWAMKGECGPGKEGKAKIAASNDPVKLEIQYWQRNGSTKPTESGEEAPFSGAPL